jgi:hypothetical protein
MLTLIRNSAPQTTVDPHQKPTQQDRKVGQLALCDIPFYNDIQDANTLHVQAFDRSKSRPNAANQPVAKLKT